MIDLAPVGPDDLGESTRELVALRCLEELSAASVQGVNHLDASSTLDFRAGFDFSRSCEDVLREIFHEVKVKQFIIFNHLRFFQQILLGMLEAN